MSLLFPPDCLAYNMARPLVHARSLSAAPCSAVAARLSEFLSTYPNKAVPESEALQFYQLNHAVALISQRRHPHEPLPPAELGLVRDYFNQASVSAQRAFYYLVIICTREARHLHNKWEWAPKLTEQFGLEVAQYFSDLPSDSTEAMTTFIDKPPAAKLGPYIEALRTVFYNGSWTSQYGGKAWGRVTDCLADFVAGKTSLEVMLDTVWTLCHNNGPIFNKGMLYNHHTGKELIKILDCQRAGVIPSLVRDMGGQFLTKDILSTNNQIFTLFPDLPITVDWKKVQDLGSVGIYIKKAKSKKAPANNPPKYDLVGPVFSPYPGIYFPINLLVRAA